jgi:hypothetical protein
MLALRSGDGTIVADVKRLVDQAVRNGTAAA